MNDDQRRIDHYADAFERRLACSAAERARRRAELVEHLTDAAEAGDLDDALARLGDPEHAAEAFTRGGSAAEASFGRRIGAALVDNLPLVAVAVGLLVQSASRGGTIAGAFPPFVYVRSRDFCVSLLPTACSQDDGGLLHAIGLPLALAWSIVGLALLESRSGATPGKRLAGLRVVTEAGLLLRPGQALVRRLSFLLGPAAWLDWLPFLSGERRRLLDHVTHARVVTAAGPAADRD
ncbi:RDD family protein [Nonomuraea pusilla]|uniref:RDD family protein n=1 Tax=Nonomuraea pusilla TaxID=46177 RepID=A0A1H7WWN0_9ACTN|nr:RDD family protein [Nonomuraea pusilla]SEM25831.1 RDD family protein [Nonomuraea pusilla]